MRIANKKSGFTLIELVVVITLLGILGSLAVASFGGVREAVRDEAAYKKLDSIEDAFLYARTTNDFDKYRAWANVPFLVSVDGEYNIEFLENDSYIITYTEDSKDYSVGGDLYNYQKPEDNVEEEKPVDNSVKEFLGLANKLFLQTAEVADIIAKEDKYHNGVWIWTLNDFIMKNDIKDMNGNLMTIDNTTANLSMYDYISKYYYRGTWPVISSEIAETLGLEMDHVYYLRPLIDYGTITPDISSIVLYVSSNSGIIDTSWSSLIFLGNRIGTSTKYSVTGAWYQAPKTVPTSEIQAPGGGSMTRATIESLMQDKKWQPVDFEDLDFKGGV